jgi:group I intron endonuclease
MIIYKATNKINGKIYIGLTKNKLEDRIRRHKSDAKLGKITYFHRAIIKYGVENFIWEIIDETDDLNELSEKEIFYIKLYESNDFKKGYNSTTGGEGGYYITQETKDKISKSNFGKKRNQETKDKMSLLKKDKPWSEERKNNSISPWLNRQHKEESKERISITRKEKIKKGEIKFKTGEEHHRYGKNDTKRSQKIKCLETNLIFNSIRECERYFKIDLKYAIKCMNGFCKTLNLTFVKI